MMIWQAIRSGKEAEVEVVREAAEEGGGLEEEEAVGVDGVEEGDTEAREGEELGQV